MTALTGRGALHLALTAMVVAVGAGAYFALPPEKDSPGTLLKSDDRDIVALGRVVYADTCAACHGPNLEGQKNWKSPGPDGLMPAPPHNETGHTWHHSDALLVKITKFGFAGFANMNDYKTAMPIYKETLSDAEIIAVLSYIKSRWPTKMQERHDQLNIATATEASPNGNSPDGNNQ